jgi:hypothetical protein
VVGPTPSPPANPQNFGADNFGADDFWR